MPADDPYQRLLNQYNELATLAGSLAHEIKNPLSVIRMNMDLLAEDVARGGEKGNPNGRVLRKIEVVNNQCVRLQSLLDDFIQFARVQKLQLTPGSLNDQIEKVLELYEPQAAESGVEIIRYLDPDLPHIQLHAETMQASVLNLVKNALESMPGGGTLVVRTRPIHHGVAFDLIDTGCGMDDKTALKMFDPFFSTKYGGSGLGLPTARKVIEAHGGRIMVQSEVGRGTKFSLEFPTPARIKA